MCAQCCEKSFGIVYFVFALLVEEVGEVMIGLRRRIVESE
jgi:hypothetical protein